MMDIRIYGYVGYDGYTDMTDRETLFTYRLIQAEETLTDA